MTHSKHVAWVSVGQFDPHLHVGGLYDLLTRLQFLQAQGHPVSILDFLPGGVSHEAFDEVLAERGGGDISQDGNVCRTVFQGVNYCHQVLPVGWEQLMSHHQPAVGAVRRCLQREGVDYAFTTDEGYWPLLAAWQLHVPGAHFFHTLTEVQRFARNPGYVWLLRRRTAVASSRFMQADIKARLGLDSAIWHPFVDLDAYRCQRDVQRKRRIGFYSAGKIKGSEIVAEIVARMPERDFLVVGRYDERLSGEFPHNLTYWGYIADMRKFYGEIDLLLVPSVWKEPYGRVILEAAVNGIPSIANRVGGIPEAIGGSGILIDRQPDLAATAEKYVVAIRRLLDDEALYRQHCQQALVRAEVYQRDQIRMSHEFRDRYIR